MRIKELFTVREGQKVTEKVFGRVLISSVCSILLCLICLTGTTWAWFTVSVENTGNVIRTAAEPQYTVQVDGADFSTNGELATGEHTVRISRASTVDDLQKYSKLYVTITIDEETQGYVILDVNQNSTDVTVKNEAACKLSWTASWFLPETLTPLADNTILIAGEETTDPDEEKQDEDDSTKESTDADEEESSTGNDSTKESEPVTDPSEGTVTDSDAGDETEKNDSTSGENAQDTTTQNPAETTNTSDPAEGAGDSTATGTETDPVA